MEISQNEELDEKMINNIRHKYGLEVLETQVEQFNVLFDESNVTGALEIKLESDLCDFDSTELSEEHILSESSGEEEEEEEEDESGIEQLSDSQLKKHDESLQFQESSESDHEKCKKRRKKYRKSEEEKLFE